MVASRDRIHTHQDVVANILTTLLSLEAAEGTQARQQPCATRPCSASSAREPWPVIERRLDQSARLTDVDIPGIERSLHDVGIAACLLAVVR
jgi:hypothetical protein